VGRGSGRREEHVVVLLVGWCNEQVFSLASKKRREGNFE
jgi:hypothetical protein